MSRLVQVEYFFAGGCSHCAAARQELRDAAESVPEVRWTEVDIAKEPMRAVDLGIVVTPAVVIDGQLAFSESTTPEKLRSAIEARRRGD